MIAQIVPIQKIRSGVEMLSYLVPEFFQSQIKIGARVIVPFRSSQIVGIVWQIDQLTSADKIGLKLKSVSQLIDQAEFIDQKGRELLTWIANYYLTALPTVLAVAIPEFFYRITRRTQPQPILTENQNQAQQLILVPYLDYPGLNEFRQKFDFIEYSQRLTKSDQVSVWRKVASGEQVVIFGTYQPIYLPFKNLKQITILEPENDLFKYEQNPKIHITTVAQKLAKLHGSKLIIKSYSSLSSLSSLTSLIQIVDISAEKRLINFQTESWLERHLEQNRRIVIFYNVYDIKDGKSRFGIKSLKADLEKRYPQAKIVIIDREVDLKQNFADCQIIIGTAKMLYLPKIIKGDLLIPMIDPSFDRPDFQPDKILAQINKLGRFSQSIFIQTKKPEHPFTKALAMSFPRKWESRISSKSGSPIESGMTDQGDKNVIPPIAQYLSDFKQKKQKLGQFPYGFWIRLSYSDQSESNCQQETEAMIDNLKFHLGGVIEIFGPSSSIDHSKTKKHRYSILIKIRDDHTGSSLRDVRIRLLKLKKPWSLDPHPVNLV